MVHAPDAAPTSEEIRDTLIKFISRVAVLPVATLKIGFRLNANSKPRKIHHFEF